MEEQTTSLSDSKDRMVSGFRRLLADAEELLRGGSSMAREGMEAAGGSARDVMGRMRERLTGMRDAVGDGELMEGYRTAADRTVGYVREHPGAALGVAVAVGVVLGALLAGHRR